MNHRASMRLDDAIWRRDYSEWILFGMARDNGAGRAASSLPENAVENENRHSVLMSLDYIPDLCNSSAGGLTSQRKPTRERRTDLGVRGVPPFRSGETEVIETPTGGDSTHNPRAKT